MLWALWRTKLLLMEQEQRQKLVKALNKAGLDATSVENPAYPGTPDIQFIGGWIECKYLDDWPAHKETTVRIPHFTQQQRVWLLRRELARKKLPEELHICGRCYLVLYVSKTREWLIFDGETSARRIAKDGCSREVLYSLSGLTTTDIKDIIRYVTIS